MPSWLRWGGFGLAALASLCFASDARAQIIVVSSAGEPPALAHAELAYASGGGAEVTWLALRVQRGPLAVVAALPEGVRPEAALDAWFAALETSASPNIVLPRGATDCGKAPSSVRVTWPRAAGVAAQELRVDSPEDAAAVLNELGLQLPELPSAPQYVVWSWPPVEAAQTTRTLRLAGVAAPLTFSPSGRWPVFVTSITQGPTAFAAETRNDALSVTYVAGRPASDYRYRVLDWLETHEAPLLEARGQRLLFDWSILADTVSLPPLVQSYARAAALERAEVDADLCGEQLRALRDADAPSLSACPDALDVSLALAASGPEQPTLQRVVRSGAAEIAPGTASGGGEANAPVLRAAHVDLSACPGDGDRPPRHVPPISRPVEGSDPPRGMTPILEETVVEQTRNTDVSCGSSPAPRPYYEGDPDSWSCHSNASSSSDSCSGDSVSASESETGCASDTSASREDDASCSSDSSSSGDSGCDSDSSSSSSESTCSGGSENGYDGETCTGGAAPGAEPNEKAHASPSSWSGARPRPRRLKVSAWSLAFAAVLLPIRRLKRPR